MEQKLGRKPLILTVAAAALAYWLRLRQLDTMYDEAGLVIAGSGQGLLTWLCIVMTALFGVYALFLRPRTTASALASRLPAVLAVSLLAGAGLAAGSAATILRLSDRFELLLGAFGLISALCWIVTALDRFRGRSIPAPLFMVPALYFSVTLIYNFRQWSQDPMILDYCFDLLALICVMCASFHLGGFCFDKGRRRICVFFCCCGVVFCAASMAGGRIRELCSAGGAMLWLLANLWPLLRPARSRDAQP